MRNSNLIGTKIKSLRESKNKTIEDIAESTSLSTKQIQSIESNENLPCLAPLIKIARALGVRLGTFLDDVDNLGPVVCKSNKGKKSMSFSDKTTDTQNNLNFTSLAETKAGRHMEPFMIDIDSSVCGEFPLSTHEGEEFIFVMDGEVEIIYGNETYHLEKGDSIYYDSIVKHNVHAGNTQKAKILAVVYTPF